MANKMRDIREILNQYNIPWKYGDKEEVEVTVKMFKEFIKGWEQGVKDQYEAVLKTKE